MDPRTVSSSPRYLDYKNACEIVPDRIPSFSQMECKTQERVKQCGPFQEPQIAQEFEQFGNWVQRLRQKMIKATYSVCGASAGDNGLLKGPTSYIRYLPLRAAWTRERLEPEAQLAACSISPGEQWWSPIWSRAGLEGTKGGIRLYTGEHHFVQPLHSASEE